MQTRGDAVTSPRWLTRPPFNMARGFFCSRAGCVTYVMVSGGKCARCKANDNDLSSLSEQRPPPPRLP